MKKGTKVLIGLGIVAAAVVVAEVLRRLTKHPLQGEAEAPNDAWPGADASDEV